MCAGDDEGLLLRSNPAVFVVVIIARYSVFRDELRIRAARVEDASFRNPPQRVEQPVGGLDNFETFTLSNR